MSANQEEKVHEVKRRYAGQYLQRPEVSGVGVEKDAAGQYVIAIHVNTQDPRIPEQFPSHLEGIPVRTIYSGPFQAYTSNEIAPGSVGL
jgi:hypothetical protein